ncbi:MAG: FHA domain-containing protein [Acidobacteria bacterium]|nr:FHA domain-containing protein [Acidobacteriota bacterium]
MTERPFLEYNVADQKRSFLLTKPACVIGRAPDCDLVLPFPMISRQHARVFLDGANYFIQDMKSANGTFVGTESAQERHPLKDGDKIQLGEFALLFRSPAVRQVVLSDEYDMDAGMTISIPISRLSSTGMLTPAGPQARDPHEMVQLVFNAAKNLVGSVSLDDVLDKAMNLVFEYLKPDRGLLMLYDEQENQLVPRVVKHGRHGSGGNMNFSRTIVNKVFSDGVSILTANAMRDQRFTTNESIMIQQIRSCMSVPLWDERKTIGIIYVDSLIHENLFQQRDLDLMSTIAVISAIAIEQYRLNDTLSREKAIRGRLERYHSPSVINRIRAGGEDHLKTEEREISVLFADLVKFTTFSERMDPSEVARVLNTHFSAMTDVIFRHEGTLDKYIGDAVMAIFGAPLAQEDHARRAVMAAVEMFQAIQEINRSGMLSVPLQMRIGINSGKVVAGDIGSERRMDYTVLGSTVNIASRIESSVAKAGEIVIGELTCRLMENVYPVASLGPVSLRGLSTPMHLYRVEIPPRENLQDSIPG